MVVKFNPPTELVDAYNKRKDAEAQAPNDALNTLMLAYAKVKSDKVKEQGDALGHITKLADNVDFSDPNTVKALGGLFKKAGISPDIFNPSAPAEASTSTVPTTPAEEMQQASLPSEHSDTAPALPNVSPVIQHSLASGHPDILGLDPNKLVRTGGGRKKLAAAESVAKFNESVAAGKTRDAANAPASFDEVDLTMEAAGKPELGKKLIENAKALGQDTVQRKSVDAVLKGLGAANTGIRGGALDSMAETRAQALRHTLNQDAKKTLNPLFQTGEGRNQMVRLNAIGRAEPLITQMLSQKNAGDERQMRELATQLDRIIRGAGQSAQSQIDGLLPHTAQGKFASWKEWFTNDPTGTDQKAFINRYADTIKREKTVVQGQVKDMAEKNAPTLRVLKEHYPEDFQAQLDSVMKNPSLVGKSGPEVGTIEDGHEFLGGDPADQNSWKKVAQ